MKHVDQSGFSIVEAVVVLVIVGILGIAGWYVYRARHTPAVRSSAPASAAVSTDQQKTTATAAKTPVTPPPNPYAGWQTFTSSDGVYTVSYPSDWVGSACSGAKGGCSTDSASYDNYFSPSADPSWQAVAVQHTGSSLTPQAWFDQYENLPSFACLYGASTSPVRGYPAYFVEVYTPLDTSETSCPSSPPASTYSYEASTETGYMDYYVIANGGQVVMFSMPVQDGSDGTRDTAPLVTTFDEIAQSIKFNA